MSNLAILNDPKSDTSNSEVNQSTDTHHLNNTTLSITSDLKPHKMYTRELNKT